MKTKVFCLWNWFTIFCNFFPPCSLYCSSASFNLLLIFITWRAEMPGFEANFRHPLLLKRHECPICLFAMRHPVQTECGHLFCRDCLEPVLKRHHPICPLDKEEITQEGTFPDNACRREILKLQVFCNFQNCPWIGALKDLEVCTAVNCMRVFN